MDIKRRKRLRIDYFSECCDESYLMIQKKIKGKHWRVYCGNCGKPLGLFISIEKRELQINGE